MSDNSNEIIYSIENVSEVQTFLNNLVLNNLTMEVDESLKTYTVLINNDITILLNNNLSNEKLNLIYANIEAF